MSWSVGRGEGRGKGVLGKCGKRCGKVHWSVRRGEGRCGEVWGEVGKCREMRVEVWGKVWGVGEVCWVVGGGERDVGRSVGIGGGKCVGMWGR